MNHFSFEWFRLTKTAALCAAVSIQRDPIWSFMILGKIGKVLYEKQFFLKNCNSLRDLQYMILKKDSGDISR